MRADLQGRESRRVLSFALYGETTGEVDEHGLPVRLDWARRYRGRATVVYGHTPVAEPEWRNRTLNIDTGCVFGGALTALRWPELSLAQVPAARPYATSARAFPPTPATAAAARPRPPRADRRPRRARRSSSPCVLPRLPADMRTGGLTQGGGARMRRSGGRWLLGGAAALLAACADGALAPAAGRAARGTRRRAPRRARALARRRRQRGARAARGRRARRGRRGRRAALGEQCAARGCGEHLGHGPRARRRRRRPSPPSRATACAPRWTSR
jgi:hypothetical protein